MERDVARAITRLLLLPTEVGTYHVAGGERSPTLASIVEPVSDVRYLGVDQFAWQVSKWRHEKPRLAGLFDELETFIYELAYPKISTPPAPRLRSEARSPGMTRSGRCSAKARPSLGACR